MKNDRQKSSRKLALTMLILSLAVLAVACVFLLLRKAEKELPPAGEPPSSVAEAPSEGMQESVGEVAEEKSESPETVPEAVASKPFILPELAGAGPMDLMKALEYQQEYLPAGYTLSGESDGAIANPGYVPDFKLPEFAKGLALEIPLRKAYVCKFKGEHPITYIVLVPENGDKAPELRNALASKYSQEKDAYASVFSLGIHVVAVSGAIQSSSAIDDLVGKLKKAIGYS